LGVSIGDSIAPTIYGQTFQQGFTPTDTVTLDYIVSVSVLQLPPPLQFCTQKYVPPSTIVSDETATDQLSVYVQECVPIYNIANDTIYADATSGSTPVQPTYTDTVNAIGTSGSAPVQPYYTDTFNINGLAGSAVVGLMPSTSYTGGASLALNGFT